MIDWQMSGQFEYPKNSTSTGLSEPVRRAKGRPFWSVSVTSGRS